MKQPYRTDPNPLQSRGHPRLLVPSTRWRGSRSLLILLALTVTASLLACALSGCSMTRWLEVPPGEYVVTRCPGQSTGGSPRTVQQLRVDRDSDRAVFVMTNGAEITTALTPRDKSDWPSGCPTNVLDHRMEVLGVEEPGRSEALVGPGSPVLVRDCPRDPVRIVLRADGDIGNARGSSGTACSWTDACICFAPAGDQTT